MSSTAPHSILQTLERIPFIAWVVFYAALSWGVFGTLLGAVAPSLRAEMGLDFQAMGTLMAVWSGGSAVGSLLGGEIAKRWPPQWLFLLYSGATLFGVLMIVQSTSYTELLLWFSVIAIFETALFTLGHGMIAQLSHDAEERGRILSLVDVGYSAGTLLSPLVVGLAFALSPQWRSPYWVFAGLALLLVLAFLPRAPFRGIAASQIAHPENPAANSYRSLLTQPVVLWMVAAGVSVGLAEWGQYFWFVSYAVEGLSLAEPSARLLLGAIMAGMVAGRLWQAFGRSRWPMGQKMLILAALGAAALALFTILGAVLSAPTLGSDGMLAVFALINFAFGLGVSVAFPILLATCIAAFPAEASRLSALLMISITLGAQIAAIGVGVLSDALGIRVAYVGLLLAMLLFVFSVRALNRAVKLR